MYGIKHIDLSFMNENLTGKLITREAPLTKDIGSKISSRISSKIILFVKW